jgi:hypothetical protein
VPVFVIVGAATESPAKPSSGCVVAVRSAVVGEGFVVDGRGAVADVGASGAIVGVAPDPDAPWLHAPSTKMPATNPPTIARFPTPPRYGEPSESQQ